MIMKRDEATILRELGTDLVDECKRRYADWHEVTEAAQHEPFDMLFQEIMQFVEEGMFERAGFKATARPLSRGSDPSGYPAEALVS
jgi:hypothetical protein